MKRSKFLIGITLMGFLGYAMQGRNMKPIEELDIASGAGIDVKNEGKSNETLQGFASIYVFPSEQSASNVVRIGEGPSIARIRADRQRKVDKKILFGVEKIYLIGERYALHGIENQIDISFTNATTNDVAAVAVIGGDVKTMMEYKIIGFPSSADFMANMLTNLKDYMFFSEDIELTDVYIMSESEGRNLVIPYVKLTEEGIEVAGSVIFRKFKMVQKLSIEETRQMNLMSNSNGKGVIDLKKGDNKYASINAKVKRKVECEKEDGNYKFVINITVAGDLIENNMYPGIASKKDILKEYEKDASLYLENECKKFIAKMQGEYKLDLLELGRIGASKYGRHTGVDWDEVVTNSSIEVNVKVKLAGLGRGDY